MASRADRAKGFWKTVKAVSVREIAREAARPVRLAVVGQEERRADVLATLGDAEDVRQFDSTAETADFPRDPRAFDFVIDAGGGRIDAPVGSPVFSIEELGGWNRVVPRLFEERPDLTLALGRRFPGLREEASRRVIQNTSTVNAEFAMVSALPGVIPIVGAILPASAIGDIIMLTKNQAMMMFRLAAIYQLPVDVSSRSRDLGPLLANAFGWRALARELVGAVPGGVGLVARGTIAYAGTAALGKGIQRLYATGQQPTRALLSRFYKEAAAGGKELVTGIARRITAKRPRRIEK
jgi:uncharacterized protein (DUF697 family)